MRWVTGLLVALVAGLLVVGSAGAQGPYCGFEWPPTPPAVLTCKGLDHDKDGTLTVTGDYFAHMGRVGEKCAGYPYTPTACGGGGTPCPSPTSCPGGVCELTEAQGVDFVNGVHTLVILAAVGVPCLVALVTGLSFLFFRRG